MGETCGSLNIADLAITTDIIVSSRLEQHLCVQVTSFSDLYSQYKFDKWEKTLKYWVIERGLFLSYNPAISK